MPGLFCALLHTLYYVYKGGIFLASQGSVIARVYTSDAYIPLPGVPVTFTLVRPDGIRQLLAVQMTDSSGLTPPLRIDTPNISESLTPGISLRPYASVDIAASVPGYGPIAAKGVQIFPGVETIQGLQLRPRPVIPNVYGETVENGSQNL